MTVSIPTNTFNAGVHIAPTLASLLSTSTFVPNTTVTLFGSTITTAVKLPFITNVYTYYLDSNIYIHSGGSLTVASGNILSGYNLYVSNDGNGGAIWAEGATFSNTLYLGSGSTGLIKYCKFTNSDYNYFDGNMGVTVTADDFSASKARSQGSGGPVHLEGNWWGSTDTAWISNYKIYDHTDVTSLPVISFIPVLSAAPVFVEHLVFTVQPSDATAGAVISPAVQVAIEDPDGLVVVSDNSNVTVAIGANPGGGTLSGSLTVGAVNGVATFGNLAINTAGTGYTLIATDGNVTGATSGSFNIIYVSVTYTWSGNGSNSYWTTAANWVGGAAPQSGDNLVFPAGAKRMTSINDYPASTVFGSITVAASGYHFHSCNSKSSSVTVQAGAKLEAEAVSTGTLTLGAGSVLTITAISGGPQAESTISDVAVAATVQAGSQATASTETAATAGAESGAESAATASEEAFVESSVSSLTSLPAVETDEVVSVLSVVADDLKAPSITSLNAATVSSPVAKDQSLPAASVDTTVAIAPLILQRRLLQAAEMIGLSPALASVALDVPLPAKSVDKPSAWAPNAMIRDYLFSLPSRHAAPNPAAADSALNGSDSASQAAELAIFRKALLAADRDSWEKSFTPSAMFAARAAGDAALQQALHDNRRGEDWFCGDDLDKAEKWQKVLI
jgi:hypothetical protein